MFGKLRKKAKRVGALADGAKKLLGEIRTLNAEMKACEARGAMWFDSKIVWGCVARIIIQASLLYLPVVLTLAYTFHAMIRGCLKGGLTVIDLLVRAAQVRLSK